MRALLLLALLLPQLAGARPVAAQARDEQFTSHAKFEDGPLRVTLLNYEVPRNKPYLIVHFEIANPSDQDERCDWKALVTLQRQDGTSMASNYDVLVDIGTGGARASGPFLVAKRRKARASVLFILSEEDLPGYLVLPDGRRSPTIHFRGKLRPG